MPLIGHGIRVRVTRGVLVLGFPEVDHYLRLVDGQAEIIYPLEPSGLALQSRGSTVGSPWRLIDPKMTPAELDELPWEIPRGRVCVSGQGGGIEAPDPRASARWWILIGDRTGEQVTLTCREPDGDRLVGSVDVGGAWVAQWLGPAAECVVSRSDQTVTVPLNRRAPTG
jgi:hypothetical protein